LGWQLQLDGEDSIVTGRVLESGALQLTIDTARRELTVIGSGDDQYVFIDGECHVLSRIDPLQGAATAAAGPAGLASPMPGRVIALLAEAGAQVAKGTPLLLLEAMKIEHTIVAPGAGTIRAFRVAAGEQVAEGVELVDFVLAAAT
jgi:3-methylcrotonyl-CoA carboxylase alpha subunit